MFLYMYIKFTNGVKYIIIDFMIGDDKLGIHININWKVQCPLFECFIVT